MKKTFAFLSANKTTEIHGVEYTPIEEPVAVLQVSHGVTEYIERYTEFAEFLNANGIVVVGNDHLGHGKSIARGAAPMYFGPEGSWDYAVKDLLQVYEITKSNYPEIPYYILGFSMGSFLVRKFLIDYPSKVDGAIIMGTGQADPISTLLGLLVAKSEAAKVGESNTSKGIENLTFGNYNKKFAPNKTKFDWLCSDEKSLAEYASDPLIGGPMSAGLFRELLNGMAYVSKQKNVEKMNKDIQVLFISGASDPVGNSGKGVRKAVRSFERAGMERVEMKLYDGLRHDLLHEVQKDEIYKDILNWIKSCR